MTTQTSSLPTSFPLAWPTGWQRTPPNERRPGRYGGPRVTWTVARACEELILQLSRAPIFCAPDDVVISTNVPTRADGYPRNDRVPSDPGAAVYFRMRTRPTVLACDRWAKIEHNLRALSLHVEALRALDRHGVGTVEQAFQGYLQLPGPGETTGASWWEVLQLPTPTAGEPLSRTLIDAQYYKLAKERHPDIRRDDGSAFRELARARAQGLAAVELIDMAVGRG